MATSNNRFALFSEEEGTSADSSPVSQATPNPFQNQIADDSTPWQEVRRRGAPPAKPALEPRPRTMVIKNVPRGVVFRPETSHKPSDLHENWCGVCNLRFPTKNALQTHMKQSPEHQNYCNLCKRVFKDRNGLKNHVDNAKDHDVSCNLCLSAFKDEWGLKNHFENNYHVGHEFACMACLLGFKSKKELEKHLQVGTKHTWCGTCHRRFSNQEERDEHWRKTLRHRHCLQPGCEFDGPDEAALNQHIQKDHFPCEGCERILPSKNKLKQHYEACPFSLTCSQCGEKWASKSQSEVHREHCHLCEKCRLQAQDNGNFDTRIAQYVSTTEIICWCCNSLMHSHSSLIKHLESSNCPKLRDPTLLLRCLGQWWYSALYMDIDIHAQIRTGRITLSELQEWVDEGQLNLFVCRGTDCGESFVRLSELVRHWENNQVCEWDVARLNVQGLEKEVKQAVCEEG